MLGIFPQAVIEWQIPSPIPAIQFLTVAIAAFLSEIEYYRELSEIEYTGNIPTGRVWGSYVWEWPVVAITIVLFSSVSFGLSLSDL